MVEKITKSLLKQDSYQRELGEKIKGIRNASAKFAELAQLCSYQEIAQTRFDIQDHKKISQNTYDLLVQDQQDRNARSQLQQEFLGRIGNRLMADTAATQHMVQVVGSRVQQLETMITRFNGVNAKVYNISDGRHGSQLMIQDTSSGMAAKYRNYSDYRLTLICKDPSLRLFQQQYRFDRLQHEKDLRTNHKPIEALSAPASDRLTAVLVSQSFQQWLASPSSDFLFVNYGMSGKTEDDPSTFLCAHLSNAARCATEHLSAIYFFSRQHSSRSDPLYGAEGLLISFAGQLLLSYPQLKYSGSNKRQRSLRPEDNPLYSIIESFVAQLPAEAVVFCIIEGINIYEEDSHEYGHIEDALDFLVGLAQSRTRCLFKLLITCPWNSRQFYKLLPDQDRTVLWIPSKVPARGRLTRNAWATFLEKNLGFLQ